MDFKKIIKKYYRLTKPGIIYGNIITTVAGFLFASKGHISIFPIFVTVIGTSLVIASACVFNNYIDRDIDKKMERTKYRTFVTGNISVVNALVFATFLGVFGALILGFYVNMLTLFIGLIGFFDYVVLYGITKRTSEYGTLVGSIAGATPIVAGYTAVTNRFDLGALLLFIVLCIWQMPHFYSIAIYRMKDYAAAKIPVLSVRRGVFATKIHITLYIFAFLLAILSLRVFKFTGNIFIFVMGIVATFWFVYSITGFWIKNTEKWARKMFFISLLIILILSLMLSLNAVLK